MKIRKVINHGNIRYRVTANLDGDRTQRFFPSKREAKAWMAQVNRLDPLLAFWESLPNDDRRQLSLIHQTGNRLGIDMNTILKSLGTLKLKIHPRDLREAVDQYLTLRASQNLRKSSYSQIRCNLKQMVSRFHTSRCDEITTTMMEDWFQVKEWKRSTIDGVIAKVGPFLNWCIRESYCIYNPLKFIILPKKDDSEPVIFTVEEVERLMIVAHQKEPLLIPYLALGIFAGVRPEEIQRLCWEDVGEDEIEIRSIKAKTRRRRLIEIAPNLRQWLCLGGPIAPKNKRRKLDRLRKETGVIWAHDIMRHTFASYHLAKHGSADKTSVQLGHSDTQMLITHYRKLVSKDNAERFWSISPLPSS